MKPTDILAEAVKHGVRLTVDGDKLAATPASKLPDSLRSAIKENKEELLDLLSRRSPDPDDGWDRLKRSGARLGETVTDGKNKYQLWGITPRGAICFNGRVFRTISLEDLGM